MATLPTTVISGEATKTSWANAVRAYLSELNSKLSAIAGGIANGSFELPTDGVGDPDNWDVVESNTTFTLSQTAPVHGEQNARFQFGNANGTGTLTNDVYTACAAGQRLEVTYRVKGSFEDSTGGLPHKAQVVFYTDDEGSGESTSTLVDESDTPIYWDQYYGQVVVPDGKTFFKVRLQAGDGSTGVVGETVDFDDVGAGVYHGTVWIDEEDGTAHQIGDVGGSGSTRTIHVGGQEDSLGISGERPKKVYVRGEFNDTGTGVLTIRDGNSQNRLVYSWNNETWEMGPIWVTLDERGEFTVITSNPLFSGLLYMIGYEV